jgi:hypothetical protein
MTLIRELIAIPEQVHQGDFVLKLAEGVAHAEATLSDYVVTPQLNACFNDALNFIKQSVQGGTSKAAYLHGSFGSGKSHFMAVLNLLLDNNVLARSMPELAEVVARHNSLDAGPQVPARPVSHDRCAQHGVGNPRRLRRVRAQAASGGADPGLLPVRAPFRRRAAHARSPRRRGLLP